jgi:serine/threonine-protein kinase HipA
MERMMNHKLSVSINNQPTGILSFNGIDDIYSFRYEEKWINNNGFNISPHITPEINDSDKIKRFLSNLLPEGRWLEELSFNNQVSKSNIFGLIAILGNETSGALTYKSEDNNQETQTAFRLIPETELKKRIKERDRLSIATWDGKQRLSIAGMQEKLPVMIQPDGLYGFGEGDLASTHIMKFNGISEAHMVINEFICMKLAEKIKIPAAAVSLVRFEEPVLLVERFDREWNNNKVRRIHCIDGCQILDLPPSYKYERPFGSSGHAGNIRTGASLKKLFEAADLCSVPARSRMDLLNRTLYQLIIGNCDAHGKNITFFISEKGVEIAPAYDMLNVDIYGTLFDNELAMAIGDEFSINKIRASHIAEFCEENGLKQRLVAKTLSRLCDAVSDHLENFEEIDAIKNIDEKDFAIEVIEDIKHNALFFKDISKELPGIVL